MLELLYPKNKFYDFLDNKNFHFHILDYRSKKCSSVVSLIGAYDEVTFPTKMKEKGTGVVLANSSQYLSEIKNVILYV